MPFTYDTEQRDFIESVTDFIGDHVRRHGDQAADGIWAGLVALDLPALLVPVELGGLGLSAIDMVAVLEAAGRFGLAVPLAMTIAGFTPAVAAGDPNDDATRRILAHVLAGASGTIAPTCACPQVGAPPSARLDEDRITVSGVVIPDAGADLVALPAWRADIGASVLVVAAPDEIGVSVCRAMDAGLPVGTLDVENREMIGAVVLEHDARPALLVTWVGAAAELVGLAAELIDRSAEYARNRVQFGRAIGHFQAVKHRLADAHIATERARSLTLYAAVAIVESRHDAVRAAHRAKASASEAASAAARAAVQVHGGAGIATEHAVSGLYLRARQKSILLGSADEHYACACTDDQARAVTATGQRLSNPDRPISSASKPRIRPEPQGRRPSGCR